MKLEAIGIGDGVSFRVVNGSVFYQQLNTLKGRYRLVVEKYRRSKSQPQLGYYYSCCLPMFIDACFNAGIGWEDEDGVLRKMTIEQGDLYAKSLFCKDNIIDKHSGEVFTIPAMKRAMSTTEMNAFINQIRDHSAEYLNTYIPEPGQQIEIAL